MTQIIIDADTIFHRIGHQHLGESPDDYIGAISTYMGNILIKLINVEANRFNDIGINYIIAFTDETNTTERYRSQFDKESVYKENRKNAPKPKFIPEMKNYIASKYGDSVYPIIGGWGETDDYVSVLAHECKRKGEPYIVAACDKDLLQVPGVHYNYIKDKDYVISNEEADRNFFKQLLTGDVGDNIPGIYGIGPKKAGYLLDNLTTPEEMWDATLIAYMNAYKDKLSDDEITDILYERGNKLWLKRTPYQIWVPPIPSDD